MEEIKECSEVKLINPSVEDAVKLQIQWNNALGKVYRDKIVKFKKPRFKPITRRVFQSNTKNDSSPFKVIEIDKDGVKVETKWEGMNRLKSSEPLYRIRTFVDYSGYYMSDRVVCITDEKSDELLIQWK